MNTIDKLAEALRALQPQPLPDLSGHNDTESRRSAAEWARGWNAAVSFLAIEAGAALAEYDAQRLTPEQVSVRIAAREYEKALEGLVAKMTQHIEHDGCACCHTKSWRDELTTIIKERSNG